MSAALIPQELMSVTPKLTKRVADDQHESAHRDFRGIVPHSGKRGVDTHSDEDKAPADI